MMIPRLLKIALGLLATAMVMPAMAEIRSWTTVDGKTLSGEYIDATDTAVTILVKGKERNVKLERLSEDDKAYVAEKKKVESKNKVNNNFSAKWPGVTNMEDKLKAKLVSEDADNNEYIYETSHFRFYSPAKLNIPTVSEMGRIFEGTYTICKSVPLNFPCRRYEFNKDVDDDSGAKQEKLVARLYLTKADYLRELGQGFESSAGVFRGATGDVLVPFESLGITKKGNSFAIATGKKQNVGTLIHELTHQMSLHGATYEVPIWFAEGLAEYMRLADYQRGRFSMKGVAKNLKPYIIGGPGVQGSRNLGKSFTAPSLEEFLGQSTPSFQAAGGQQIQFNYGFSTLLMYYFAHLDGNGDGARLKRWMRDLQETQRAHVMIPSDATPEQRAELRAKLQHMVDHPDYKYDKLLDGRTWAELQAEFSKKVGKLGIDVKF